jgi:hypothetical protein
MGKRLKKRRKTIKVISNKTKPKAKTLIEDPAKLNCSPKDKNEINGFTCYTSGSLYKLRDKWNARHPDAKINTNDTK